MNYMSKVAQFDISNVLLLNVKLLIFSV